MELEFASPPASAAGMISLFVAGIPAPGGSKRGFAIKKGGVYTGRVAIMDAAGQRNKDWRAGVVACARDAAPTELLRGPLRVDFAFIMPRPQAHYTKPTKKRPGTALRDDAPHYHTKKPDRTKLMRSTEDALTGVIWADDTLIVAGETTKIYGEKPGCHITITPLL